MLARRWREAHPFRQPTVPMVCVVLGATAVVLLGDRPLVDAVVVGGIGLLAPLALGAAGAWTVAAVAMALALTLSPGPLATALVLPALGASGWSILDHFRRTGVRDIRSLDGLAFVLAPVWATVAVVALMASVGDVGLLGFGEPLVRLTAVHYLYAGIGALTIARRLRSESPPGARVPAVAVMATLAAPPIVAAGFVLGHPVPQIGGAVLMTVGVWSSALVFLANARHAKKSSDRLLRGAAGLTPWVPMVLAVAWATAQHVAGTPALSIPDMARFHGLVNGIGFVFLGLLATQDEAAVPARRPQVEVTS